MVNVKGLALSPGASSKRIQTISCLVSKGSPGVQHGRGGNLRLDVLGKDKSILNVTLPPWSQIVWSSVGKRQTGLLQPHYYQRQQSLLRYTSGGSCRSQWQCSLADFHQSLKLAPSFLSAPSSRYNQSLAPPPPHSHIYHMEHMW